MTFKNAVLNTPVESRTWNGMKSLESTLSKNVDLFYKIGASRGKDITKAFEQAYHEDRNIAIRIIQWARDIRGGSGERQLFRQVLKFLEKNYKSDLMTTNLLNNISKIGRWDDLLIFEDIDVKNKAFEIYADVLLKGAKAKAILGTIDNMSEEQCQTLLHEMQ